MSDVVAATDGVQIAVSDDGDGEPMVVLHGFVGSGADWAPLVPELVDRGFRVVVPDHRGHGSSTRTGCERSYTFDGLVDDVRAVIGCLELGPCHLVGHSMGGFVALQVALDHPDLVRSLVLVDCSPAPTGRSSPSSRRLRAFLVRRIGLGRLVRWVGPVLRRAPFPAGLVAARRRLGPTMVDDLARRLEAVDPAALSAFGTELGSHRDLRPRLAEVRVPTTVVVGQFDSESLRRGAHDLATGIGGATLRVVDGAAHSPHEENPRGFLAVVDEHRRRL